MFSLPLAFPPSVPPSLLFPRASLSLSVPRQSQRDRETQRQRDTDTETQRHSDTATQRDQTVGGVSERLFCVASRFAALSVTLVNGGSNYDSLKVATRTLKSNLSHPGAAAVQCRTCA